MIMATERKMTQAKRWREEAGRDKGPTCPWCGSAGPNGKLSKRMIEKCVLGLESGVTGDVGKS